MEVTQLNKWQYKLFLIMKASCKYGSEKWKFSFYETLLKYHTTRIVLNFFPDSLALIRIGSLVIFRVVCTMLCQRSYTKLMYANFTGLPISPCVNKGKLQGMVSFAAAAQILYRNRQENNKNVTLFYCTGANSIV